MHQVENGAAIELRRQVRCLLLSSLRKSKARINIYISLSLCLAFGILSGTSRVLHAHNGQQHRPTSLASKSKGESITNFIFTSPPLSFQVRIDWSSVRARRNARVWRHARGNRGARKTSRKKIATTIVDAHSRWRLASPYRASSSVATRTCDR